MNNVYVADFETTTDPDDCRVWGWGLYNVYDQKFQYAHTIESFARTLFKLPKGSKVYFHNLKFDLEFFLYYLFENGFSWSDRRKLYHKEFNTLITDRGVFYSSKICYRSKEITLYDSLKLMNFSVDKIAKTFDLPIKKGSIDYDKPRPVGYKMTDEEIDYLRNDVVIVGEALKYFFDQQLTKMTQASNSLADYKDIITGKRFKKLFPKLPLEVDEDIRHSYKGGWTYVKEEYKGKELKEGIVYDVNSLYPSVMYNKPLPYGEPKFFDGEYTEDRIYPIYIQKLICQFEIKEKHLPTIQLKKTPGFIPTEYVKSSQGNDVTLILTNVDLELFKEHYNIYNPLYVEGWKFKASTNLFKAYIDKWIEIKNRGTIEKNEGMRTIAKLMLNALYGKFALNPHVRSKIPYYEDGLVHYALGKEDIRPPLYVPVSTFITAYARELTIRSAQLNYDRFIYADTDSMHLIGKHEPDNIEVDPVKLGAWKEEYKFTRGKFLRAKAYIEELEDKTTHIACAGLPHRCHTYITFENFEVGLTVPTSYLIGEDIHSGKLQHKRVKGGVVLKAIEYSIKP